MYMAGEPDAVGSALASHAARLEVPCPAWLLVRDHMHRDLGAWLSLGPRYRYTVAYSVSPTHAHATARAWALWWSPCFPGREQGLGLPFWCGARAWDPPSTYSLCTQHPAGKRRGHESARVPVCPCARVCPCPVPHGHPWGVCRWGGSCLF